MLWINYDLKHWLVHHSIKNLSNLLKLPVVKILCEKRLWILMITINCGLHWKMEGWTLNGGSELEDEGMYLEWGSDWKMKGCTLNGDLN